ncbi:MepB family protein [Legionella sp.]|uniref:MepB family protein n=1 Tax=Legionella sp. TaxID=459 RepID=UPI003CA09DB5
MFDLILNNQKSQLQTDTMHQELVEIQNRVYSPLRFKYSQPAIEPESAEYCAYSFELNNFFVRFRVAKITPTKIGQFVTLWKRFKKGPIKPYDNTDSVDFFIINTRKIV